MQEFKNKGEDAMSRLTTSGVGNVPLEDKSPKLMTTIIGTKERNDDELSNNAIYFFHDHCYDSASKPNSTSRDVYATQNQNEEKMMKEWSTLAQALLNRKQSDIAEKRQNCWKSRPLYHNVRNAMRFCKFPADEATKQLVPALQDKLTRGLVN